MEVDDLPDVDVNQQQIAFHGNMDQRACFQYFRLNQLATKGRVSDGLSGTTNVQKADAPRFGEVVLKTYHAAEIGKTEAREMMAFMKYHHPNKVTFYGLVFDNDPVDQVPCQIRGFVMEYMEGGCLHEAIHNKKPQLPYDQLQAVSWAKQACRALSYLHLHRVMHRDVKPAIMLLSADKRHLKMGDFRSAKEMSDSVNGRHTASVGPLRYAAPEVIENDRDVLAVYDYKCDTYSMAITFNEILTRDIPYGNANVFGVRNSILTGVRPEMNYNGPLSEKCKRITNACWETNVNERKDMDWMLQQLESS